MASSNRRKISSAISDFSECVQTQQRMMEGGSESNTVYYQKEYWHRHLHLISTKSVTEFMFHIHELQCTEWSLATLIVHYSDILRIKNASIAVAVYSLDILTNAVSYSETVITFTNYWFEALHFRRCACAVML